MFRVGHGFRFLKDPLFLGAVMAYLINRVLIKPLVFGGFWHDHFNDLICVAVWVPVVLWLMRKMRVRSHDLTPLPSEVMVCVTLWMIMFEVVLPGWGPYNGRTIADPYDIPYYLSGALGALMIWGWIYRASKEIVKSSDAS